MGLVSGRKSEHETVHFACKVAAAGDERYLVCAAGAAAVLPDVIGPPMCSATSGCVYMCLILYAFLESAVADRIGMAA